LGQGATTVTYYLTGLLAPIGVLRAPHVGDDAGLKDEPEVEQIEQKVSAQNLQLHFAHQCFELFGLEHAPLESKLMQVQMLPEPVVS